ncbi:MULTISPECIES: uroporphyrinogen-III synthase [unclassified Solibacillus]|uniref:uroporphyrinogen-III synthase n=1 Tax=unclassified Solibacillus TaxID=2637870 RepID=UPI0030F6D23F
MPSNALLGKTIIITGSAVVQSVQQLIEQHGGKVYNYPLIETAEIVSDEDNIYTANLDSYQWLIFTSQNAVTSFINKCERSRIKVPSSIKVAAVGEKTATLLQQHGYSIHFMPTVYSADVFVKEFVMEPTERALFLRGSMAKSTIHNGTGADEWTVYETRPCTTYLQDLEQCILEHEEPIVIFASPSAVDIYAEHIVPNVDWRYVKFGSIGHVTTSALAKYGVEPIVQPKIYTMQAVIEQLILEEQKK